MSKTIDKISAEELLHEKCTYLKSILEKHAVVTLNSGEKISCYPITIDPLSRILTVVRFDKDNKMTVSLITPSNIKFVTIEGPINDIKILSMLSRLFDVNRGGSENLARKRQVIKWLNSNLLEVEEEKGCIKVMNQVAIHEPYTSNDCEASNTIVLKRIRNILEQMPAEFN